jgi:hypothetical protein
MPCSQPKSELYNEMVEALHRQRIVFVQYVRFTEILNSTFPHVKFPKYCRLGMKLLLFIYNIVICFVTGKCNLCLFLKSLIANGKTTLTDRNLAKKLRQIHVDFVKAERESYSSR